MDTEPTAEEIKIVVQPSPRELARREREARESKRRIKEIERRKVESARNLKFAFLPVLGWFSEHGEPETQERAVFALLDWEKYCQPWIQWGQESGYLGLVQRACANFEAFRAQSRKAESPTDEAQRVHEWVLAAGKLITKREGFKRYEKPMRHRQKRAS